MATDTAKQVVKGGFYKGVSLFFEYDTPKIVHIKSKKVGVINRLIQLLILAYVIGYAIVWEKGYQEFDAVVSAASTKVKGVTFTNFSGSEYAGVKERIWDTADYIIPPQENNAFFVMTNAIVTVKQTQSTCPEDASHNVNCTQDTDCPKNEYVKNGNGMLTGTCNTTVNRCEIYAWCPVEIDDHFPFPDRPLLDNSEDFTVLIKNQIEFPKFNAKRRNILESYKNKSYLQSCNYHKDDEKDQFCPIFRLGYIVEEAGENYTSMAIQGGFILININWDCNLDRSIDKCVPQYSFRRLDDKNSLIAPGWNFRYANYYYENDVQHRDLVKAYGIRFVIEVTGRAGKFSAVPLLMNLGSGLALLAVATVLCDIITLYLLKKGDFYKEKKYLFVEGDDAFKPTEKLTDGPDRASYDSIEERPSQAENDGGQSSPTGGVTNRRSKPGDYKRMEEEEEGGTDSFS